MATKQIPQEEELYSRRISREGFWRENATNKSVEYLGTGIGAGNIA
jgi:hypothetical protein